ncbi:MAG TPA: hypothetical protein G4O15_04640 [Dehalococcoidia bacterium]|nr:hypothetical protein [Dehalococcoidia bacterium]
MNGPLAEMFRYNRWANLTLLDACRGLTSETLTVKPPGLSGTIGEILIHIVGGQQSFILRTKGRQHEGEMNRETPWPGIDIVIKVATVTSDELLVVAEELDQDRDVELPYLGTIYRYPLSFFLVHAFEHGVEHRTEVKVGLGQLGITTPDLDGWAYADAMGYG